MHYEVINYSMGRPVGKDTATTLGEAKDKAERMPPKAQTQGGRKGRAVGIKLVRP